MAASMLYAPSASRNPTRLSSDRFGSEFQRCVSLVQTLEQDRESWRSHWADLARWVKPRRYRPFEDRGTKGERRNGQIIESTATHALQALSAGMMALVTSPAKPWFRLSVPDPELSENGNVSRWLHVASDRMRTVFLRSNLYHLLPGHYADLGLFGTALLLCDDDDDDVLRFQSVPVGAFTVANDRRGKVRTMSRQLQLSVQNIVEWFAPAYLESGKAADLAHLSQNVQDACRNGQWLRPVEVVHLVTEREPGAWSSEPGTPPERKRFGAWYWETGTDRFLHVGGTDLFPGFCSRWDRGPEDAYATDCPGMTALGEIREVNLGRKRMLQAIEKGVSPPMQAPYGMRNNRISFAANEVTYRVGQMGDKLEPLYQPSLNLNHAKEVQEEARQHILRAFHTDLFLMLVYDDRPQRATAREIEELTSERLLALAPLGEQLNHDLLDPLIDVAFEKMLRRGLLPPVPEELAGVTLKVEYLSMMGQAQKMLGVGTMERFVDRAVGLAEVDPAVLDGVDLDQHLQDVAEALSIPPGQVRTDEEREAIREARADQMEAQAQAETAKVQADALAKMGTVKTDDGNLAADMLAAAGGAGGGAGAVGGLPAA